MAAGESQTVEFKSHVNDRELVKAVACLANGGGGTLLLGVNDDGTVVGAQPRHGASTDPHRVAAYVQNATEPALAVAVTLEQINERQVVRIDVPDADPGPVGTKDGVFTKRVMDAVGRPQCRPMTVHEIVGMGMLTRGQDFATAVARDATIQTWSLSRVRTIPPTVPGKRGRPRNAVRRGHPWCAWPCPDQ